MSDSSKTIFRPPPNWSVDRETGVRVRQVTSHAAIHHQPFFYVPAYDDAVEWLFFVSHQTGRAQVYGERRADHAVVQLTDRTDLNEWSVHPAHAGRYVYDTAGAKACRVELDTLREDVLADFGAVQMLAACMVGAGMGTTAWARQHLVPTTAGGPFRCAGGPRRARCS